MQLQKAAPKISKKLIEKWIGIKLCIIIWLLCKIEYTVGQSCENSVFPLVYGKYVTNYFDSEDLYDFKFCKINNPVASSIELFSNGDLLVAYHIQNTFIQNNYKELEMVAKIDKDVGKTIWAKIILLTYQLNQAAVSDLLIVDDNIWIAMDITYATFTSYGALVKLDMDGKVLFSKIFSNNIDSGVDVHVKYLVVNQLIRISNDSISLNGCVNKLMSSIGYSTDSYVDQIIINFDSNGYTKWASVFEYNSTYDSAGDMALYDSILYSSLFAEGYACFFSINSTNGKYIQSNTFTTFVDRLSDIKEINIRAATSFYILGLVRRTNQNDNYDSSRLFILSRDTLLPQLIFSLYKTYSFYPIYIDSGDVAAKLILIRTNNADVISLNSYLDIIECLDYSITNNATFTNNMRKFKTYDENTAYFITNQGYNSNLTDEYGTTIISKTNISLNSSRCETMNLDKPVGESCLNDIVYIKYTPNGTDPKEIHWVGSELKVKYINNTELFNDVKTLANFTDLEITSCFWPNYIPEYNQCSPNLPQFLLGSYYQLNIGTNITLSQSYIPFDHCENSRFIFRICLENPIENSICNTPPWISIDEVSKSVSVQIWNISSVGIYKFYFQVQLIAHSLYFSNNEFYSSVNSSVFEFKNNNVNIISQTTDWYLLVGITKTIALSFYDIEGDNVILKLTTSEELNAFISQTNNTCYNLIMLCNNSSIK